MSPSTCAPTPAMTSRLAAATPAATAAPRPMKWRRFVRRIQARAYAVRLDVSSIHFFDLMLRGGKSARHSARMGLPPGTYQHMRLRRRGRSDDDNQVNVISLVERAQRVRDIAGGVPPLRWAVHLSHQFRRARRTIF